MRTSSTHLAYRVGSAHRHFSIMYDQGDAVTEDIDSLGSVSLLLNENVSPTSTVIGDVEVNTNDMDLRLAGILNTLSQIKNS